jgi:hypothetical protein
MISISKLLKKVLTRIDKQKSNENAKFRKDMKIIFNDKEMFKDKS